METNHHPPKTVSLDKIATGVGPVAQKRTKDAKDRQEEAALSQAKARAEIATITESNRDLRVNRRMRHDYAKAVFLYLIAYSVFAGATVVCAGWRLGGFELPTIVLAAIVGSTAVSAIGLVGIVVTGLFKSSPLRERKGKENV